MFQNRFFLFKRYFEEAACTVLKMFDENENDLMNGLVLLQKSSLYGDLDCFDMALQGDEVKFKFFSMPSVQTLLTNLWNGEVKIKSGLMNALKVC